MKSSYEFTIPNPAWVDFFRKSMRNSLRKLGVLGVSAVFFLAPDALKKHEKKIIGLVAARLRWDSVVDDF